MSWYCDIDENETTQEIDDLTFFTQEILKYEREKERIENQVLAKKKEQEHSSQLLREDEDMMLLEKDLIMAQQNMARQDIEENTEMDFLQLRILENPSCETKEEECLDA